MVPKYYYNIQWLHVSMFFHVYLFYDFPPQVVYNAGNKMESIHKSNPQCLHTLSHMGVTAILMHRTDFNLNKVGSYDSS